MVVTRIIAVSSKWRPTISATIFKNTVHAVYVTFQEGIRTIALRCIAARTYSIVCPEVGKMVIDVDGQNIPLGFHLLYAEGISVPTDRDKDSFEQEAILLERLFAFVTQVATYYVDNAECKYCIPHHPSVLSLNIFELVTELYFCVGPNA